MPDPAPPAPAPPDLTLLVRRLDPGVALPAYARTGDAGLDLVAAHEAELPPGGGRVLVGTGLAVAIPAGWAGFVQPRSGLALRHGVTVLNTPGLIDSGYRDELKVLLLNTDPTTPYRVERGDRIAQLVLLRVGAAALVEVAELDDTDRTGGFGHTGR